MNHTKDETSETFSLEDILREFGTSADAAPEPAAKPQVKAESSEQSELLLDEIIREFSTPKKAPTPPAVQSVPEEEPVMEQEPVWDEAPIADEEPLEEEPPYKEPEPVLPPEAEPAAEPEPDVEAEPVPDRQPNSAAKSASSPKKKSSSRTAAVSAATQSADELGLMGEDELEAIIREFSSSSSAQDVPAEPSPTQQEERLEDLEKNLREDLRTASTSDFFEEQFGGFNDTQDSDLMPEEPAEELPEEMPEPVTTKKRKKKKAARTVPEPIPAVPEAPLPEDLDLDDEQEELHLFRRRSRAPRQEAAPQPAEEPAEVLEEDFQSEQPPVAPELPVQEVFADSHDDAGDAAADTDDDFSDPFDDDDDEPFAPFSGKKRRPEPEPERTPTVHEAFQICGKQLQRTNVRVKLGLVWALLALLLTAGYSLGWQLLRTLTDPSIVAWCVNGLLVLSLLCCGDVFTYGLNHLKKKQITLELLTVLSGLVALADGIMAALQGRVPYGATACVLLWLAQWNRFLQWEGMYRTLKVLEKNDVQIGIVRSENVYRGKAALFTAEITPEAFMEQMQKPALSDLVLQIYAPLAFLLTLALAILTHVREQAFFLQCWTPMLLAAIPVAGLLCYGRTFAILARRLARRGSALCGWAGACAMGNDTAVLLRDLDLFPAGSVEPNGVKSYNGYTGTQVVGYAAAVLEKAGSGLAPVLDTLLEREGGRHMQAEAIRLYENGGIGGKFGRDAILVGTLSFMRRMGVHMNTETRVKRATYVSVNGELAGLIAVRYSAAPSVREALQILTRSGRVKPVLATCNVTITPKMLHQKFHIAQDRVEYPDLRTRAELAGKTADPDSSLCAMLVQDQLSSFSDTAVGGRILQTVVRVGLVMAILSGIAAVAVLGVLSLTGAIVGLSASYLLLFDLIWLVPVLLLTGWTRNY